MAVTRTEQDDQFERALAKLFDDLPKLRKNAARLRNDADSAERRIQESLTAVESLLELIEPRKASEWRAKFTEIEKPAKIAPAAGRKEYQGIVELLISSPKKSWRANSINQELRKRGIRADQKYVHNTLRRLASKGALVKVRRGEYRLREGGMTIVTSDNLDGESAG